MFSASDGDTFDYSALSPDSQVCVREYANEIKQLVRKTATNIVSIGKKLCEAKEKLGHGNYEDWLRSEFSWGLWTARKFMQVARQFESVDLTNLSIDVSALYALAAPSTSDTVRQEALERAGRGESITRAKVKLLNEHHRKLLNSEDFKSSNVEDTTDSTESKSRLSTKLSSELPSLCFNNSETVSPTKQDRDDLEAISLEVHEASRQSFYKASSAPSADNYASSIKYQLEKEVFEVGSPIYFTDLDRQDTVLIGQIVEIKEVTSVDVVIKISLE